MDSRLDRIANEFQKVVENKRWTAFNVHYVPDSTGDRAQLFQAIKMDQAWKIGPVSRPFRWSPYNT